MLRGFFFYVLTSLFECSSFLILHSTAGTYFLLDELSLLDSFAVSLLLAGALVLLSRLLLLGDELTLGADCLEGPEDPALCWLCAGLEAALSGAGADVLPADSALWLCAGLEAALSGAGADVLPADSTLWLCTGLEAVLSEVDAAGLLTTDSVLC